MPASPIPFLTNADGKYVVSEEAKELLNSIDTPLAVSFCSCRTLTALSLWGVQVLLGRRKFIRLFLRTHYHGVRSSRSRDFIARASRSSLTACLVSTGSPKTSWLESECAQGRSGFAWPRASHPSSPRASFFQHRERVHQRTVDLGRAGEARRWALGVIHRLGRPRLHLPHGHGRRPDL